MFKSIKKYLNSVLSSPFRGLGGFLLLSVFMWSSCAQMTQELPECEVEYVLRFRFDMNLLYADAFHTQVNSVTVYAYDEDGRLAWTKSEKGDALAQEGYTMDITEYPTGEYDIVAWCGLENDGERQESFIVPEQTLGTSLRPDIHCRMERKYREDGSAYSDTDLYKLFHGTTHVSIGDKYSVTESGTKVFTVPLTKDTNSVRIILQQLSGEDMQVDGFSFKIEDNNGHLEHDNSLRDDETITYHEWNRETGEAGITLGDDTRLGENDDNDENVENVKIKVAIADLTVGRLMADHPTYLTITNPEGKRTARIPLVDYALLTKAMYSRSMTDQEYLDRQDRYVLTFFLDKNNQWIGSSIIINSWRIVLHNYDI